MTTDWQKNALAYTTGTLTSALGKALEEVCTLKGKDARQWLDGFERKVVSDAKNIVTEGIGMEDEIKGTNAAVGVFQMIVAETRKKLR